MAIQFDFDKYRYKTKDPVGLRGKLIIINNVDFKNTALGRRNGSELDVARMETTFKKLGFDCEVHISKTTLEMFQIMLKVEEEKLVDYDCLAVAIFTHGEDNDLLYGTGPVKDGMTDIIALKKLLEPVKRIGDGKPKLVFVQACRGYELDKGNKIKSDQVQSDHVESDDAGIRQEKEGLKIPMEADFLYHYATSPGYVAFRNDKGSIFIQMMCDILDDCSKEQKEFDLLQCLTHVNLTIAEKYESNARNELGGKKQMPSIVSMLRKRIFLKGK